MCRRFDSLLLAVPGHKNVCCQLLNEGDHERGRGIKRKGRQDAVLPTQLQWQLVVQDSDNLPPRSLWFPNAHSGIVASHAVLFRQALHKISAYFTKVQHSCFSLLGFQLGLNGKEKIKFCQTLTAVSLWVPCKYMKY